MFVHKSCLSTSLSQIKESGGFSGLSFTLNCTGRVSVYFFMGQFLGDLLTERETDTCWSLKGHEE